MRCPISDGPRARHLADHPAHIDPLHVHVADRRRRRRRSRHATAAGSPEYLDRKGGECGVAGDQHHVLDRGLPLHQLTFVPDSEGQFTSDHGWSFPADAQRLRPVVALAKSWGVRVSLFMDAEPQAMAAAKAVGADRVELYTEPYAAAWGTDQQEFQLSRFATAAQAALASGLAINAGHDLNRDNLGAFLRQVPGVSEVSIGHALIADALELGYDATVRDYLRCMASA